MTNVLADIEAQPISIRVHFSVFRTLSLEKLPKQILLVFHANSNTCVLDSDLDKVFEPESTNGYGTIGLRKLDRVANQIDEDLLNSVSIHQHFYLLRGMEFSFESNLLVVCLRVHDFNNFVDDFTRVLK